MLIDIIFAVLMVMAIFKGYSKGLIVAVLSLLAVIIGLAAAMKLSVVVSEWLMHNTHIGKSWLPLLSFAIVMLAVIFVIRWIAALIQASAETLMLGWLNRIGGMLLYALLYAAIFSVALFYLTQMHIIKQETIQASVVYPVVEPVGPWVINAFGKVIPLFRDMFEQLQAFFESVANKA
ncbi:CvpA family protein [Foetidibacter luteolus]|uniref:CvpA family protein n=1 Tax=Foetidibacter luteolus TaxID=2608880 RepID=UPI00129A3A83|nr:CvpA family protein [Foetidibacter luteolus]